MSLLPSPTTNKPVDPFPARPQTSLAGRKDKQSKKKTSAEKKEEEEAQQKKKCEHLDHSLALSPFVTSKKKKKAECRLNILLQLIPTYLLLFILSPRPRLSSPSHRRSLLRPSFDSLTQTYPAHERSRSNSVPRNHHRFTDDLNPIPTVWI